MVPLPRLGARITTRRPPPSLLLGWSAAFFGAAPRVVAKPISKAPTQINRPKRILLDCSFMVGLLVTGSNGFVKNRFQSVSFTEKPIFTDLLDISLKRHIGWRAPQNSAARLQLPSDSPRPRTSRKSH